ncbi:hypothetical protein [Spiroplasma culicicola]|uniref:Transmembrane protein n=1 Tax=Spiroplasma culicicola AES-1 TaxID=1276246 RepID=W6A6D8_9MOLU|nr:hypothetical protein [Spiroplasma culicicola]AHI52562.1 hypothetical protein SCULI_v1c02210 [Spiroplasma culicicola AES-1]
MRKVRIWRFLIMFLVATFCLFFVPFFAFSLNEEGQLIYIFGVENFNILTYYLIALTIVYLATGFLANGLKNKPGKVFGVFNTISAFSLIVLLSIYAFYNIGIAGESKLLTIIPTITFIAIDTVLAIVHISINLNQATVVQQVVAQPQAVVNVDNGAINLNTVELRDATELKLKIQNMQSGLNKSYDEAIEEIEKTGALNGLEIGQIIADYDEPPKIVPYIVEPNYNTQPSNQPVEPQQTQTINQEPEYYRPRREDPLAQIENNDDYQSIHSNSVAPNDAKAGGYKYLSRRINDERESH